MHVMVDSNGKGSIKLWNNFDWNIIEKWEYILFDQSMLLLSKLF